MALFRLLFSILPTQMHSSPWQKKEKCFPSLFDFCSPDAKSAGEDKLQPCPRLTVGLLGTAHINPGVTGKKLLCRFSRASPESPFPKYLVASVPGVIALQPRGVFQEHSSSGCFLLPREEADLK